MTGQPDYPLDRSLSESKRLDAQHRLWVDDLGYLVHPVILSCLTSTSCIADIGTGTGIYLVELAQQLPSTCQFDGFDISDKQYPETSALPANVKLSVHNAKLPFPDEYHGRYDLVHLRLLVSAMSPEDWAVVTRNVCQLLKPGGAIQWAEPDMLTGNYLRGGGATTTRPDTLKLVGTHFFNALIDRFSYSASNLASIYGAAGLKSIIQDVVSNDRNAELRARFTQITFEAIFGWAYQVAGRVPGMWSRDEVDELRKRCELEIQGGAYIQFNIVASVGVLKGVSLS